MTEINGTSAIVFLGLQLSFFLKKRYYVFHIYTSAKKMAQEYKVTFLIYLTRDRSLEGEI